MELVWLLGFSYGISLAMGGGGGPLQKIRIGLAYVGFPSKDQNIRNLIGYVGFPSKDIE